MLIITRNTTAPDFEPGKLIVMCKPGIQPEDAGGLHESVGASILREIPELKLQIVSVRRGAELETIEQYGWSDGVLFAEPNYIFRPSSMPSDPYYSRRTMTQLGMLRQWGLRRINPEPAWDALGKAHPSVPIAVLDSGIDGDHPDLAGKINAPLNLCSADPGDYYDRTGHGTAVAGIAAAVTDNRLGIAGASHNAGRIIPVRLGDSAFPLDRVISGILHAVMAGARVINMSFGSRYYSHALQLAVDLAARRGIALVAAAGDLGRGQVIYPAGCNRVLAVSSTNRADSLAHFSNWGVNVGISAPGEDILTTAPGYPVPAFAHPNYDASYGSSLSASFASGVAALLMAVKPKLTGREAVQAMEQAAMQPGCDAALKDCDYCEYCDRCERYERCSCQQCAEWGPFHGYGLLNAGRAAQLVNNPQTAPRCRLGSFCGQVVAGETGLPVAGALIMARREGRILRQVETRDDVPTLVPELTSDGMFRLMNLPEGVCDISVDAGAGRTARVTGRAVPGADVFLRIEV